MRPGSKRPRNATQVRPMPLNEEDRAVVDDWKREHGKFVFGILYRMANHWQDAEDLDQNFWGVKVGQKLRDGKGPRNRAKPRMWLRRCAVRLGLDWGRRRKRHVAFDESSEDRTAIEPLAALIRNEQAETLNKAIKKLLDRTERKIVRWFSEGYPLREIAEWLDVPVQQVSHRLRKALDTLGEGLEKTGEIPPRRKARLGKKSRSA